MCEHAVAEDAARRDVHVVADVVGHVSLQVWCRAADDVDTLHEEDKHLAPVSEDELQSGVSVKRAGKYQS